MNDNPQSDLRTRSRWRPLVGGGLLNVALGTYYAWSVYVPALEREFGGTRSQTSLVATIDMATLASTFMIAGLLQDRFGARPIAFFGGVMFSLGLLCTSFVHSLSMLYLTAGLMVGVGLGFGYLAPITVGSKWFPGQRGLVNGLAIGIFAAGSGIFGPVAGSLIGRIGWRATFQVFAAVFLAFTMVGAYLLKDPPVGFQPPVRRTAGGDVKRTVPTVDVATSQVLRLPTFYLLWFAYALGAAAGTMVISQLVPFARSSGFNRQTAAFAISVGALGSALGRFLSGWMSDHLGRLPTLRAVILISMIATPLLYVYRENLVLFYSLLFIVYYCYGTQLSVYTALAGDFWGSKYLATNVGLLLLAWGFAGIMGPILGSRIYVSTGTYQYAFYGAAVFACAALVNLCIVRAPAPPPAAGA